MPKPPPNEDFRVTVTVPKPMLGEFMADCAKRGLDDVRFDLVTSVKTFNKNPKPEISTNDTLLAWIPEHPTFRAIEAVRHFKENGHSATSAYPALAVLVEKGVLKKLGPGEYSRADIKHIAAPKKEHALKGTKRKVFDRRGSDVILAYAKRNHGRFATQKIVELFAAEGRARNSVSTSVDMLVKQKLVKRVGEKGSGQYALLTKTVKAKPAKPPVNSNSKDAAFVEAVTNG